jgi:hypothetical protein
MSRNSDGSRPNRFAATLLIRARHNSCLKNFVIDHVTIFDGNGGPVLKNGVIAVKGDRIRDIAAAEPSGADRHPILTPAASLRLRPHRRSPFTSISLATSTHAPMPSTSSRSGTPKKRSDPRTLPNTCALFEPVLPRRRHGRTDVDSIFGTSPTPRNFAWSLLPVR